MSSWWYSAEVVCLQEGEDDDDQNELLQKHPLWRLGSRLLRSSCEAESSLCSLGGHIYMPENTQCTPNGHEGAPHIIGKLHSRNNKKKCQDNKILFNFALEKIRRVIYRSLLSKKKKKLCTWEIDLFSRVSESLRKVARVASLCFYRVLIEV